MHLAIWRFHLQLDGSRGRNRTVVVDNISVIPCTLSLPHSPLLTLRHYRNAYRIAYRHTALSSFHFRLKSMSKTRTRLIQEATVFRTPQLLFLDDEGAACYLLLLSSIPVGFLIGGSAETFVAE